MSAEVSADLADFVKFAHKSSVVLPEEIKKAMIKRIREVGKVAVKAVKDDVVLAPLTPAKTHIDGVPSHRNLRANIAKGVGVSLGTTEGRRVGVYVRSSAKYLPPKQKGLLKKYNRDKGWRRPSLGTAYRINVSRGSAATLGAMGSRGAAKTLVDAARAGKWYAQKGRPYFGKVIASHADTLEQAMIDAVQDARRSAGL